jgi:hypothetical protein
MNTQGTLENCHLFAFFLLVLLFLFRLKKKAHLFEEVMWQSNQDARTISSVLLTAAGTTVCHSLKHLNSIIDLG